MKSADRSYSTGSFLARAKLAGAWQASHRPRMDPIRPIPLEEIKSARDRIADVAIRTPLIPLDVPDAPCDVHLK